MNTPISSGMPNSRLRPIAVPMTSARSVAQMAISANSHSTIADRLGERVAARLGEVASRREAETRAQRLQQDRHDVRHQRDAQQRVAELRAAGERGRPVAGVHIADGNEVARPEEREETAPADAAHRNRAPHLTQRRLATRPAPATPSGYGLSRTRRPRHVLHRRFLAGLTGKRPNLVANDLQLQDRRLPCRSQWGRRKWG